MRLTRHLVVVLMALLLSAPAALADPNDTVGGAGSHWFSGSLLQQDGNNCSVLGNPYTETMVSGIASYGGTPGGPRVDQTYYPSLLLSVPGNPCGTGSSAIGTDLVLPPNTAIDTSAPIRCFGKPNNQPWGE